MSSSAPLSCLAILDASQTIAGRYCARLFAKLGARVERCVRSEDSSIGYGGAAGLAFGRWLDEGKLLDRGTVIFDDRRLFATRPAPTLGEHDEEVFASLAEETFR